MPPETSFCLCPGNYSPRLRGKSLLGHALALKLHVQPTKALVSHLASRRGEGDGPTKGLGLGLAWPQSCTSAHACTQLRALTQFQVLHFPGSLLGPLVLLQTLAPVGKAQSSFPLSSQQPLFSAFKMSVPLTRSLKVFCLFAFSGLLSSDNLQSVPDSSLLAIVLGGGGGAE